MSNLNEEDIAEYQKYKNGVKKMKWQIQENGKTVEIVEFETIQEAFDYAEEKYAGKISITWTNEEIK